MSSRTDADSAANGREGLVGVATQGGNGADADHDDEGQHHGVLNGRRAIFRLQEIHNELTELLHDVFLSEAWQSAQSTSSGNGPMALRPRLETGLPFRGTKTTTKVSSTAKPRVSCAVVVRAADTLKS